MRIFTATYRQVVQDLSFIGKIIRQEATTEREDLVAQAALRVLFATSMTVSTIAFTCNLLTGNLLAVAVNVATFVLSYDCFRMLVNEKHAQTNPKAPETPDNRATEVRARAHALTHRTILKPIWMGLYVVWRGEIPFMKKFDFFN